MTTLASAQQLPADQGLERDRPGSHARRLPRRERLIWDANWAVAEPVMEGRALVRLGAALGWALLAVVTEVPWWPATVMVGAATLSYAHARRRGVLTWAERLPPRGTRLVRWLLPYPEIAHADAPPGWAETIGLLLLAYATGVEHWFAPDPAAEAVAVLLIGLAALTYTQNLAAHINWEMGVPKPFYRWVRPLLGIIVGGVYAVLLIVPLEDRVSRTVAGATACAIALTILFSITATRRQALSGRSLLDVTTPLVREADAALVHSRLKNPARLVRDDLEARTPAGDPAALDRIRRLCQAISLVEHLLDGKGSVGGSLEELKESFAFERAWASGVLHITDDLVGRELAAPDSELLFIAVSDLLTNAYSADPERVEMSLTVAPGAGHEWLTLAISCRCGHEITEVAPNGSLMRLADLVIDRQGSFTVDEHGAGHHTFIAGWPLTPRAKEPQS